MNKRLNGQQEKVIGLFQYCHHVLAGRINASKRCMLKLECFHCAYDQWLDAIDLERAEHGLTTGTSKPNLAKVA